MSAPPGRPIFCMKGTPMNSEYERGYSDALNDAEVARNRWHFEGCPYADGEFWQMSENDPNFFTTPAEEATS